MSDEELGLLIVFLEGVEHLLMSWGSGVRPSNWSSGSSWGLYSHYKVSLSPPPHSPDNITTHITPALAPGRPGSIHSLTAQLCPEFLLLAVKFHESGKMTTTSVAMLAACSEWRGLLLSELEQLARRRNWCKLWSEARARTFAVWR